MGLAIEYSIYVLIFFIPISIALVSVFTYIAVVLFWIKQLLSPDFTSIKNNKIFFLILLFFFIFMAMSLMNSGPFIAKSLNALFLKWGRFPLILWMIVDTFRDPRRIVKAAGVFLFSATLVGFSVFSQKYFGLEFLRHRPLCLGYVTGPFKSKSDLAAYLICIIPIALSFSLWQWKKIVVRLNFFLILMILMASFIWTYCRGGMVGLGAGLIFFVFFINFRLMNKKLFWAIFPLTFFFCVPLIGMVSYILGHRSASGRVMLIQGAWKMIVEHPFFGKGLGTFMDYSAQYTFTHGITYAHNCYFQIWAESGIFSLLSFLVLNGFVYYKSIKLIFRMPASFNFFLIVGINAGLLGCLVHSFFDTQFYSFQLSFLYWILLGLTVTFSSILNQELVLSIGL